MELQGTIIDVFREENGISKSGKAWRNQPFLLETDDQHPRKVYIEVFGDEKIKNAHIRKGAHVTVGIDIESTEYNGRYFTKVRAWKVEKIGGNDQGDPFKPADDSDLGF